MKGRRIALVGGAGFIGSNLFRHLKESGWQVEIFDLPQCEKFLPGASVRPLNIADPTVTLDQLLAYDAIVLLAGLLGRECEARPEAGWSTNIFGPAQILSTLLHAGTQKRTRKRVIFLSSAAVYDQRVATPPYLESSATGGHSLYSLSKLAIEYAIRAAVLADAYDALILRPFTVFGHHGMRGRAGHLLGIWLDQIREQRPLTIHGRGEQGVDLVSVDYVSQTIETYLNRSAVPPLTVLNVASGEPLPIREVAAMFQEVFGQVPVEHIEPRSAVISHGWADIQRLTEFLDAPIVPARAMLRAFLEEEARTLRDSRD